MGQLVPFAQRIKSSVSDHATLAHLFFVIPRRFICAAGALTPTQGTMPLFILLGSIAYADVPISEDLWWPLTVDGDQLIDLDGDADSIDSLDIVGSTDHPAGYWSMGPADLYVRVRLSADPSWSSSLGGL